MKVLFCTDGSKISYNAITNFSKWNKSATIDIICVVDWSFLPDEVYLEENGFITSCANVACGIIKEAESKIKELGFKLGSSYRVCGSTVDSIEEQLRHERYNLVLLGSHGKKGLQKWLGSVSREIILNTPISGYISKKTNSSKKILFATDGSPNSTVAIHKTIEDFDLSKKEIYICTVTENPDLLFLEGNLDSHWILEIQKRQNIFALRTINESERLFTEHNLTVQKNILTGTPAQSIIDFTNNENIDLIVLGGRLKKKSLLAGSINKRILDNTKSDVMIIKTSENNTD